KADDYVYTSNITATPQISTLSLHDALPIFGSNGHLTGYAGTTPMKAWLLALEGSLPRDGEAPMAWAERRSAEQPALLIGPRSTQDRKSTRLNSSHDQISYAVFCLKKKKKI